MKTTFRVDTDLRDACREKTERTSVSPSLVASLILQQWVDGKWKFFGEPPQPTLTEKIFIVLPDDLWGQVVKKRQGVTTSAIIREGLRWWVRGEWEVELVKQGSSYLAETYDLERHIESKVCTACGNHHTALLTGEGLMAMCPVCDVKAKDESCTQAT